MWITDRVAILSKFFALWMIVYFGQFFEITNFFEIFRKLRMRPTFWATYFFSQLPMHLFCSKNDFSYILGYFFTNSSCHPELKRASPSKK
jgi:hypothetical protein